MLLQSPALLVTIGPKPQFQSSSSSESGAPAGMESHYDRPVGHVSAIIIGCGPEGIHIPDLE